MDMFFKVTEHPADNLTDCQVHTSQRNDMVQGELIALNIPAKEMIWFRVN